MSFISFEFLVLFATVFGLILTLGPRWQNRALLAASYVFYGWWDSRFLGLLAMSTCIDFLVARYIDTHDSPQETAQRKWALAASVSANLGMLGFFKYCNFFTESFVELAATAGFSVSPMTLKIVLPVGISFYTFQTMSYTIDVYRGRLRPTDRFFDFALYVSFFPQLVAGPIERATRLLPQISGNRHVTYAKVCSGAQLVFWGFLKKTIVADNLAIVVNRVYASPDAGGLEVILATYAFALQIYCDFSGYTDIARGVSRMIGFELCENFRFPYGAKNPKEFWERWHISLSSWLRDYLYIPLGGNRRGTRRTCINLMLTMVLGGLWHGAAWNFVLWGVFHGLLLIIYKAASDGHAQKERYHWIRIVGFFQLTCLGWMIFRVESIGHLIRLLGQIASTPLGTTFPYLTMSELTFYSLPLIAIEGLQKLQKDGEPWQTWAIGWRTVYYVVAFYFMILLGTPEKYPFIYFQF